MFFKSNSRTQPVANTYSLFITYNHPMGLRETLQAGVKIRTLLKKKLAGKVNESVSK